MKWCLSTHTQFFYVRTNTRKSYKIELILSNLISHLPMAIISTFIVYSKLFYPHLKNIYMKRHLLSNDMQTQNFPFYTFSPLSLCLLYQILCKVKKIHFIELHVDNVSLYRVCEGYMKSYCTLNILSPPHKFISYGSCRFNVSLIILG